MFLALYDQFPTSVDNISGAVLAAEGGSTVNWKSNLKA
jgi:hypothetical protein